MRFAPGFLALALLLAACPGKKSCKLHSDCSETERCVSGECVVLCRTNRDCNGAGRCVFGDCIIGGTGGGIASGGGGGSSGGGAGGGGGSLDAGWDAGALDAGFDAGVDAGFDAGLEDAGSDAGFDAGLPDAGFDAGVMDAGSGAGLYGDGCSRGGDCASGLCIGNSVTGLQMCTIVCGSEAACDQGHACLPVQGPSGVLHICVPSDSGQACPTGQGSACVAGICLLHPSNTTQSVCATPCETTHACPIGFSCSVVQVGASMQKVCSPITSGCSPQGNSNQCISRWCSTQAQNPASGICTGNCSSQADCPPGWACGLDDNGAGVVDRCQPVGQSCTVVSGTNDCFSKTCATGTPSGDYCTAFCMDSSFNQQPARCPPGWSCLDEGTAGAPLWVCERP